MRLDVNGQVVELTREQAEELRDASALAAASSSVLRDISLLLDRAITSGRMIALQRQEVRPLARLLANLEDGQAFDELRDALDMATGPQHGTENRPRHTSERPEESRPERS